jgi:predicted nucleic acid-binding protein
MERIKVYLDTSVISALLDIRTPERQQLTYEMWEQLGNYDVYISEIVIDELKAVSYNSRSQFEMQEFSGVGPEQFCEFSLQYQLPLLKRFGRGNGLKEIG